MIESRETERQGDGETRGPGDRETGRPGNEPGISTAHAPPLPFSPADSAAISLLRDLISIPSVSGDEAAAVRFLVDRMAALGFDAFVDGAGNAVGIVGSGSPETVLLGHIDTVPGAIPVRIEDGRLWGRGAVDAKGPLAAFVIAAAALRDRIRGRMVVIGCVEEEAPSSRGAHYVVDRYQPDFCIVGEPSGWQRVTIGYKGALRLSCRIEVACGHGAHDRETAAERIVAFWGRIGAHAGRFNADRPRAFDRLLPTLIGLHSGSNGLREWATAEIGIRLPPGIEPEILLAELRALDPAIVIEALGATPAFEADRSTPLVRALTNAIRQHGAQPGLVLKTGTADMNVVGPAWDCPTIAYGPGDAALDHTPDEHLVLDEYLRGVAVLQAGLERLHGAA
jgi:[amino group carrier protein]-lysine/ornithine hydrolase